VPPGDAVAQMGCAAPPRAAGEGVPVATVHPFTDSGFYANPYPTYHRLRAEAPVLRDPARGDWIVTGFAEVVAALGDARLSAETKSKSIVCADMMLFLDPPRHTRLRGLVNRAFTPRVVKGLRPRVEALVADLLAPARERGELDVIADLGEPLPGIVIAELLGVPAADRPQFKRWSDDTVRAIGGQATPEVAAQAQGSMLAMWEYLRAAAADRRARPANDLLSGLVAAEAEGDRLSENELLATCILLMFGGNETTTNLIGNGVLALLRHPEQWERLRAEPDLIQSAVEELVRYDSPIQRTVRVAREDLELGDARIGRGERISLMIGAANRDPAAFPNPDRLDVGRGERRHLAFGLGPHFCLGSSLARLEGQVAIAAVVAQFPGLRLLTEAPEWKPNLNFRGLRSLPTAC
jgi:pimeloyl-[acyl-carrier protein] synthase